MHFSMFNLEGESLSIHRGFHLVELVPEILCQQLHYPKKS